MVVLLTGFGFQFEVFIDGRNPWHPVDAQNGWKLGIWLCVNDLSSTL